MEWKCVRFLPALQVSSHFMHAWVRVCVCARERVRDISDLHGVKSSLVLTQFFSFAHTQIQNHLGKTPKFNST